MNLLCCGCIAGGSLLKITACARRWLRSAHLLTRARRLLQPLVPVAPEMFALRKLLPTTPEFDFNIHVMDFDVRGRTDRRRTRPQGERGRPWVCGCDLLIFL